MKQIIIQLCIATLICLATLPSAPHTTLGAKRPPVYVGIAARYSPGVMERVARNRKMPIVDCMIASPLYTLGTWVEVRSLKTGHRQLCRITDVSAPQDRARHVAKRQWVELGFKNVIPFCGTTRGSPRECPIAVRAAG